MVLATPATTQGVPIKTLIPSTKPGLVEGGAQIEGVSEPTSIPSKTPSP